MEYKVWRERYWQLMRHGTRLRHLFQGTDPELRRLVLKDQRDFFLRPGTIPAAEATSRAREALHWLYRAQGATPDAGVSMGYFPLEGHGAAWRPSYPETTGYIIVTLMDYAERYCDPEARERAWAMGRWEVAVQMANGAVQGGTLVDKERQTPAVFNTGMVLQGWTRLLEDRWDDELAEAAQKAARFLLEDQDANGHFRTHGHFVGTDPIKTYNVLCAWPLDKLGVLLKENTYREAALRLARAAMELQQDNGWFAHNDLTRPEAPLTHTIGYTLQGLLETGIATNHDAMIASVVRSMDRIIALVDQHGFLPGRLNAHWQPACRSSCLTGSAQIAIVGFRLSEATANPEYRACSNRIVTFLQGLQNVTTPHPGVRGALAGSFPMLTGSYMTAGYPNWATKYFLDALMIQDQSVNRACQTKSPD
ncbi:MAG: hypothetical protein HQL74_13460 [Magnetococcales bacterium]|nr:hypothetical protein [Magnetococcales bacterium]